MQAKKGKLILLTFDMAFKKMFGDNDNKERCALLLSIILRIPYDDIVDNIELLNSEKKILNHKSKKMTSDIVVRLTLDSINRINLEMNNTLNEITINRNILYAMGILSNRLRRRESYSMIEEVIQINFNLKNIDKSNEIIDEYIVCNKCGNILSNIIKIYHINIAECRKIWYNQSINKYETSDKKIILLGALLMEDDINNFTKILEDIGMNESLRNDMINVVEEYSDDENMCIWYDKEHNDKAIFNGSVDLALEQGIEQGIKQGFKNGINKRNNEIVKQMLKENIPINIIEKCTGLDASEINRINMQE